MHESHRHAAEHTRVALALCLAAERGDKTAFEALLGTAAAGCLVVGLVGIVRGFVRCQAHEEGDTPEGVYRRCIDGLIGMEAGEGPGLPED